MNILNKANKPDIEIPAYEFHILKFIELKDVRTGEIKSMLLGAPVSYDNIIEGLVSKNYISIEDSKIQLTENGSQYLLEEKTNSIEIIQRSHKKSRFERRFCANFVQMGTLKRTPPHEALYCSVTPSGFKPETF